MEGLIIYTVIILSLYAIGSLSRKREQKIENAFRRISNLFRGTPEKNRGDEQKEETGNKSKKNIDEQKTSFITDKSNIEDFLSSYNISPREWEITLLVCDGLNNREIEERLYISLATVKDHIHNIFKKTNVKNRIQLANLVRNSLRQ